MDASAAATMPADLSRSYIGIIIEGTHYLPINQRFLLGNHSEEYFAAMCDFIGNEPDTLDTLELKRKLARFISTCGGLIVELFVCLSVGWLSVCAGCNRGCGHWPFLLPTPHVYVVLYVCVDIFARVCAMCVYSCLACAFFDIQCVTCLSV